MCNVDFEVALFSFRPAERCSRNEYHMCRLPSLLPQTRRRRSCTSARTSARRGNEKSKGEPAGSSICFSFYQLDQQKNGGGRTK